MSLSRELSTIYANLRGDGIGMAAKYAAFRWLFSVHWRPISWALNRLHPHPIILEVEISTACDLRCKFCELSLGHKKWGQPAKLMPYDDLMKTLDQFPNLIWFDWTGIGEPMLHPRFLDIMKEVKRRGLYVEAFDHMNGWDEQVTDFMLDHKLNRIQPSVDGATKKTYEHLRVGGDFDKVCHNLRYLFAEKRRRKSPLPIVDMHYIVNSDNEHEMVEFVRLVRNLAGDERAGIQFTEVLYEFDGIQTRKVPITEQRIKEVLAEGRKQGVQVWINRNAEGRPKADMRDCNAWHSPFIFVDGTVVPCCARNESGNRRWQVQRAMGNIFSTPFREIWNGPRYTELRRKMRKGETPDYCVGCPVFKAKRESGPNGG